MSLKKEHIWCFDPVCEFVKTFTKQGFDIKHILINSKRIKTHDRPMLDISMVCNTAFDGISTALSVIVTGGD